MTPTDGLEPDSDLDLYGEVVHDLDDCHSDRRNNP